MNSGPGYEECFLGFTRIGNCDMHRLLGIPGRSRLFRLRPIPVLYASAGHPLAQAPFLDKVLLQATDLLVEKVIRLVNQADGDIGHDLGRTGVTEFAKGLVGDMWSIAMLANEQC